jgi:hypothetical protein
MESPEKALDAGKHERTAIAGLAEAQPFFGLHASFEAARQAPPMGRPMAFECAPTIRLAHVPPTNLMSALARALKEKAPQKRFAKARRGAGWKPL